MFIMNSIRKDGLKCVYFDVDVIYRIEPCGPDWNCGTFGPMFAYLNQSARTFPWAATLIDSGRFGVSASIIWQNVEDADRYFIWHSLVKL